MRRLFLTFVATLSCLLSFPAAEALAVPRWRIDRMEVYGRGDSLHVVTAWTFLEGSVGDNEALVACASLKGSMGEALLTPVCLYGSKLFYAGTQVSGYGGERRILKRKESVSFECEDVFAREPWMDTVRVTLKVHEWNKRKGAVPLYTSKLWTYIRPRGPEFGGFPWKMLAPRRPGQTYEVRIECPLGFSSGATKFDIDDGTDEEELERFLQKVKRLSSSKTFTVKKSSLSVFLPPGGSDVSKRSKSCSESLFTYLKRQGAFSTYVPQRTGGGEDWTGVIERASVISLGEDEALMNILEGKTTSKDRLGTLRRQKPEALKVLEEACIPYSGRAVYTATVTPLGYIRKELYRPVFDDVPEALSQYDFFSLSSVYEEGSDEWLEVMMTAAELSPFSEELNMNLVMALLKMGNTRAAVPYLRNIGESDNAKYVYAAWLFENGRYDEALGMFDFLARRSKSYSDIRFELEPYIHWKTERVDWEKSSR